MFAHALELHRQGRLAEAQAAYEALLFTEPAHADALHMLGVLAVQMGQPERGQGLIARAVELQPANPLVHYNLGLACVAAGHSELALRSYDQAIALQPDYFQAHYDRGLALQQLERHEAALAAYDAVVSLQAGHVAAHVNRGNVLRALQQPVQALASHARAIALQPDYGLAHYNKGVVLQDLHRQAEALQSFDQALALGVDSAALHNNRGNALMALRRLDEALASYDTALALHSDDTDAHCNRGLVLQELKRLPEAVQCFDRVLALEPQRAFVRGQRLHLKMQCADWSDFDAELEQVTHKTLQGEKTTPPIAALAMVDSPDVQRLAALTWSQDQCAGVQAAPAWPLAAQRADGRIRLAYFSADFHNHATMYLLAGVLALHDKSRFELFAYSFGPPSQDAMRARVLSAFDHFFEVGDWTDAQVAQHSRHMQVDIAVDLKGYSYQSRPAIFAHRAAPVQVNLIGHPGTMAAAHMDYTVADRIVIPPERLADYVEKIVYLPHCYQPNDGLRRISERVFSRAELGLPEHGFVFCSFNATYKITPRSFEGWMRILQRVDSSVLWLFEGRPEVGRNLRAQAMQCGVPGDRLVFAKALPLDEHLARHRCADLFLDTLPCNAHTTASDALWAGLPVLTCVGQAFAGRVAASLLTAVGLPELVVSCQADYEELAVSLALDPVRLLAVRAQLQAQRLHAPLFDTPAYTRDLESAYVAMVQRHRAG